MLRSMRSNLKSLSWVLWLVIFAFVGFVFVEWGTGGLSLSGGEAPLLTVGKETIRGTRYQKFLNQTLDNYKQQLKENFNASFIQQLRIPEQTLQQLINTAIIRIEADKLDLRSTNEELRDKILSYPGFQRDGTFIGTQEYKSLLAYYRIDIKEFEDELREEIVAEKLMEYLTVSIRIEESWLREAYRKENDSASIDFAILRSDRIEDEITPTESDLMAQYEGNKENYKSEEKRGATVLAFKYDTFKPLLSLNDAQLLEYYQANKTMYVEPKKTKVSRIFKKYEDTDREKIQGEVENFRKELDPENFAEKATTDSEGDKAAEGGDWGYTDWQQLSNQEKQIIENMSQGEISPVVDAGSGFSIFYVPEKVAERQKSFDEVKPTISSIIERQELARLAQTRMDELQPKLKDTKDLKSAAEALSLQVIETELLTGGQTIADLDEMGYISRQLFSMAKDDVSDPFDFIQGMAMIQLTRIDEAKIESFEVAKDRVSADVIDMKKIEMLREMSGRFVRRLNQLKDEKALEKYMQDNNLEFEDNSYKRGNRLSYLTHKKGLDEMIFSLQEGMYAEPIIYDNEVALVKLKSLTISSDADYKSSRDLFYQQKLSERKNNLFSNYIYDLRENIEIRLNQKTYNEITEYVISRFQ